MNDKEKLISINLLDEDTGLETTLRPQTFDDYIGQQLIKQNLDIAIKAAKQRNETIDHILLAGPPGLGKTTLANIIAREMNTNIHTTSGPAIERTGDLASIITNLNKGDVLFIDEIHRLSSSVEEILYSAMEDFVLDLVLGKGPGAKTVRLDIPNFTLIGATTKPGSLTAPLRDRFGLVYRLDFYNEDEIKSIIKRSAKILDIQIEEDGIGAIASRSRKTPRVANRLLKRVRDFVQVKGNGKIEENSANLALDGLAVDTLGLDESDRRILTTIMEKFNGGPVGIQAIAAACMEDEDTILDVHEPYLMQIGFLKRTPKGRIATQKAHDHLGFINKKQELF